MRALQLASCALAAAACMTQTIAAQRAAPAAGARTAAAAPPPTSAYTWFDPIIDLRAVVVGGFVDEPDPVAMQRAALDAMTRSLHDPYTVYIPPDAEGLLTRQITGRYVGIGVELDLADRRPVVVSALDDSPALAAGLLPGDVLLEVDGKSTEGIDSIALDQLLPGDPGSTVRLLIRRPDGSERVFEVERRQIQPASVKGLAREGDGWRFIMDPEAHIGYARITQFNESTAEQLDAALARMRGMGLAGLILDLRGNGGGSLDAAVKVADRFLKSGAIVSLRGRGEQGQTWDASASPEDVDVPLVVLLNRGSASASEVVAGALQDHERAKVIGTRSYGKGSVQSVRTLPDGAGMLKMTTARYYLPSGRTVSRTANGSRWGVEPDSGFHVPMTQAEQIENMRARRAWEGDAAPAPAAASTSAGAAAATGTSALAGTPPPTETHWERPEWIRTTAHDPQLAAALTALAGKLGNGEWPTVGDLSGEVGASNDELRAQLDLRRKLIAELEQAERSISALRNEGAGVDDPLLRPSAQLIDGLLLVRDRTGREVARVVIKDPAALQRAMSQVGTPVGTPMGTPAEPSSPEVDPK